MQINRSGTNENIRNGLFLKGIGLRKTNLLWNFNWSLGIDGLKEKTFWVGKILLILQNTCPEGIADGIRTVYN